MSILEKALSLVGKKENSPEVRALFDYYNKHCLSEVNPTRVYEMPYSASWCAMFLSVLAHKSGHNKTTFPFDVSVNWMQRNAIDMGIYRPSEMGRYPRKGDVIVYSFSHVGIVSEVNRGYLKVVEGNYGDAVGVRTVAIDDGRIVGYIRPIEPFKASGSAESGSDDAEVDAEGGSEVDAENRRVLIKVLAGEVVRGLHGTGEARKISLGEYYEEVQDYINKLFEL